jgi:hypothetical protein
MHDVSANQITTIIDLQVKINTLKISKVEKEEEEEKRNFYVKEKFHAVIKFAKSLRLIN